MLIWNTRVWLDWGIIVFSYKHLLRARKGTLNLDVQPTRPICTAGSQVNKFHCFIASSVLHKQLPLITPKLLPLGSAPISVHPGGDALIVCRPPADTTTDRPTT